MTRSGNKRAEKKLYEALYPLGMWKITRTFPGTPTELLHEACEWIVSAIAYTIERFDKNRGVALSTYFGECVRWFALNKVFRLDRNTAYRSQKRLQESAEDPAYTLEDRYPDSAQFGWEDRVLDKIVHRTVREEVYAILPPRTLSIYKMRCDEGLTMREVAVRCGVTPQRINQIERSWYGRARAALRAKGITSEVCEVKGLPC